MHLGLLGLACHLRYFPLFLLPFHTHTPPGEGPFFRGEWNKRETLFNEQSVPWLGLVAQGSSSGSPRSAQESLTRIDDGKGMHRPTSTSKLHSAVTRQRLGKTWHSTAREYQSTVHQEERSTAARPPITRLQETDGHTAGTRSVSERPGRYDTEPK